MGDTTPVEVGHETIVRRFYEAMSSTDGHFVAAVADEVLTPDWEDIPLPPGQAPGREGFKAAVPWLHSVFRGFTITPQEVLVAGDRVAVRSITTGTHTGEFLGVAPTGQRVEFDVFDLHHIENGRIRRAWHLEDIFAALNQMGAKVAV